jgi:hypothetical protein
MDAPREPGNTPPLREGSIGLGVESSAAPAPSISVTSGDPPRRLVSTRIKTASGGGRELGSLGLRATASHAADGLGREAAG